MKKDSYSPRMRSSFRSISSSRASIPSRDVSKLAAGAFFTEEVYLRRVAESILARTRAKRQLFKAISMAGRNTDMTIGKTSQ